MSELEVFLDLYQNDLLSAEEVLEVLELYVVHRDEREVPRQLGGSFCFDLLTDAEVRVNFRFAREDMARLMLLLQIPAEVQAKGYRVPGMTALCILLRRLAYPNRLVDLERFFLMGKSALSAVAIWMTSHLNTVKGHLIKDLGRLTWLDAGKLAHYAEVRIWSICFCCNLLLGNWELSKVLRTT